jgi:hypothetical protein
MAYTRQYIDPVGPKPKLPRVMARLPSRFASRSKNLMRDPASNFYFLTREKSRTTSFAAFLRLMRE